MEELVYGFVVAFIATSIEPRGIGKARWWVAMITVNALVIMLRNGF